MEVDDSAVGRENTCLSNVEFLSESCNPKRACVALCRISCLGSCMTLVAEVHVMTSLVR